MSDTIQARAVMVCSGMPDEDFGEHRVTIRNLMEGGRRVGFHVQFEHNGKQVKGSADIYPPNWEENGETPSVVRVNRSLSPIT
jgi:hypothetical protein